MTAFGWILDDAHLVRIVFRVSFANRVRMKVIKLCGPVMAGKSRGMSVFALFEGETSTALAAVPGMKTWH